MLIDLPIGWRLALGFLLAALIASLAIGVIGSQQMHLLNVESDFYQSLIQDNINLSTANNYLQLMNLKGHELLEEAEMPNPSQETLQTNRTAIEGLMIRYNSLLSTYASDRLLDSHPDQVALLAKAGHPVQVALQRTLVGSTLRTWRIFRAAQQVVLQKIASGQFVSALMLNRMQAEPTNADAQSALHALLHYNEVLVSTMHDAVQVAVQNLVLTVMLTVVFVFLCVALVGLLISRPLVERLLHVLRVTEAATHGQANARISVVGQDEIAVVSTSVNAMLDTIAQEQRIATAYEQERRLNQLKDQFILNVSHELRTPLTEIYGYLELLGLHHKQLDTATQLRFLDHARNGCNELMHLVNTILDATQNGSDVNPPRSELLPVAPFINELIDGLNPQETRVHPIHRNIPESVIVWADRQHVRRILRNLFSNAFKYTPEGTPIFIEAMPISGEYVNGQQQVCISVKDAGPGIPPAELPFLFQRFTRLKRDLSGSIRGTGLGLYISKQLVEAMGGRIWVESSGVEGEGCRFCFTLPSIPPRELNTIRACASGQRGDPGVLEGVIDHIAD